MKIISKVLAGAGVAAVLGWGVIPTSVHAQGGYAQGTQTAISDGELQKRVKSALHSDRALDDKHINVTVENGNVVLRGFVGSEEGLQKALRAATEAARDRKVVNNLTIKQMNGDDGHG